MTRALLLVLALAGCDAQATTKQFARLSDRMRVWTDPDTGCEYIVSGTAAITPRLAGGTPICRGKE